MSKRRSERRRVGFRVEDEAGNTNDTPDTSYMMLDESVAEKLPPPSDSTTPGESKNRMFSARELAHRADEGMKHIGVVGGMAVHRAGAAVAAVGARTGTRRPTMPFLTSLPGWGGRRAPTETTAPGGGDDGDADAGDPDHDGDDNGSAGGALVSSGGDQTRVVYLNDESQNKEFPRNYISTTKYSLLTALPMFLWEQFTRFNNAYFLFVAILYSIDAITPVTTVGRHATAAVLVLVIFITGIKEAVEDLRRYREDRLLNSSPTHILGSAKTIDRWDSVKVGDVLKIYEKEALPADIALVATSSPDGLAHIETKQLDGESNLKVKLVPAGIHEAFRSESVAQNTKGRIECEAPNDRLYKFIGRLILTGYTPMGSDPADKNIDESMAIPRADPVKLHDPVPLGPENLLIRGSSLRNTEWVLGIVVNTGRDTKLMQNVKPRPRKISRLEKATNLNYFYCVMLQLAIVIGLTIRSHQTCRDLYKPNQFGGPWYLGSGTLEEVCSSSNALLMFFRFFVLFAGLIPISLYISMEIVRGFQVYFIENDSMMKDHKTGTHAEARTSNLNEELGVIHYVFTDKTGTLTANRMDFKKCSLQNKVYEWADVAEAGATSMRDLQNALQAGPESSAIRDFSLDELQAADNALRLLAICHSVVAEHPEEHEAEMEEMAVSTPRRGMRLRWRPRRRSRSNSQDYNAQSSSGTVVQSYSSESLIQGIDNTPHRDRELDPMTDEDIAHSDAGALNTSDLQYQASSPDEAALVKAAKAHGYTFVARLAQSITIEVHGRLEHHQLLEIIEFDSTRKRMSVVTKDHDGKIRLYTKGADAVIFERLAPGQSSEVTEQHLHDFAVEGLRTLCLAYADLDPDWFEDWHMRYKEAAGKVHNREENLAALADELERDLKLLGATAIEDKLQDGVPDTLRKLEKANVKVWVLTGDKQETAINIGLSCGVIDDGMDVVIINADTPDDTSAQIDRAIGRWSALLQDPNWLRKLGVVLDGQTLHYALEPVLQRKLITVLKMARTVIACRVSPKQKTELVELVRRFEADKVTLAIGDGANDVGMIQAAHVGIGIVGLEGQEAKLASDYSIGQFRYLARLMLVHGRWSYKRLCKMLLYYIYKNAILIMCELYWATQCAFSGQPLLDPWLQGIYHLIVTSLPPILLGILDQELSADYALMFPEVYVKGQRNSAYTTRIFLSWLLAALWQSALVYFIAYWGFGDLAGWNGQHVGMWCFGVVVFTAIVVDTHAMLLVYQSSWTKFTFGFFVISLLSWLVVGPIFTSKLISLDLALSTPIYNATPRVFAEPRFWFVVMISPVLCVTPSLLWKYRKRRTRPNMKMLVQELINTGKTREEITGELQKPLRRVPSYDPSGPATPPGQVQFMHDGDRRYMFSGFNFDNDESEVVLRRGFELARGARRKRMRFLKRAGSDTELDVEGVKSAIRESPRRFRPPRYPEDSRPPIPRPPRLERTGAPAAHRRAMSDGAVLAENAFDRLHDTGSSDSDV